MDDLFLRHMETLMEELECELVAEVQGRLKGAFPKTSFDSQSINIALFKVIVS